MTQLFRKREYTEKKSLLRSLRQIWIRFLKENMTTNILTPPPKRQSFCGNTMSTSLNTVSEAVPKAQCVECGLTLSNEALKPSKLQRHLETKHPMLVGKPVDYFKRKESGLQMQKRSVVSLTSNSKCALKASNLVARRVAQTKKAFTIAEELVLPAAVDMCREMIQRLL